MVQDIRTEQVFEELDMTSAKSESALWSILGFYFSIIFGLLAVLILLKTIKLGRWLDFTSSVAEEEVNAEVEKRKSFASVVKNIPVFSNSKLTHHHSGEYTYHSCHASKSHEISSEKDRESQCVCSTAQKSQWIDASLPGKDCHSHQEAGITQQKGCENDFFHGCTITSPSQSYDQDTDFETPFGSSLDDRT
jgi:hypothetical protein